MTVLSAREGSPIELARAALARPKAPFAELPPRLLLVDANRQRAFWIEDGAASLEFVISTAAAGVGGEAGSLRTPPGWHRVHDRIGAGQPLGAVFESRVTTGEVWRGEPRADDLILSRILTLEGLEEGVNRGSGCDSLERYIYAHGTNHESALGTPASHGCVRMANADVARLFDRIAVGDAVLIVGESLRHGIPDPLSSGRFHYAGVAGSGMSALAQFQAMSGGCASGSDRAFDRGERAEAKAHFERLGIRVYPQDGTGIAGAAALVVSTAVESEVPDYSVARERGVATVHRSELLAHFVSTHRTIAVAGTSGKSTVVAMIFEILHGVELRPSVITGGELLVLQREGLWGNACAGGSDLLVVEADESDGSLVHYEPAVGVVLNLQKDHKEPHEVAALFTMFRGRAREAFVAGEDEALGEIRHGARVFGFGPKAAVRGLGIDLAPDGSGFEVDGVRFQLPTPGRHEVENALAAIATCQVLGVPTAEMVGPLGRYHGVARRFQSVGRAHGIEVVDDFAHNPAKLRAAIATAQGRARRVLAVYQPHGYGPTRFLRADLVEAFAAALGRQDRLWLLEVFYAGGSAKRDFSAADLVAEIAARGVQAEFAASRQELVDRLVAEAREGDLIMIMGARDPSLTTLARSVLDAL
ncbi:MAG TPA: L,D-transpeptidase family protein [Candidatus Eisenbacteria bacterium]|jgi:UDP-N-acetylmuramate--alanine ligase